MCYNYTRLLYGLETGLERVLPDNAHVTICNKPNLISTQYKHRTHPNLSSRHVYMPSFDICYDPMLQSANCPYEIIPNTAANSAAIRQFRIIVLFQAFLPWNLFSIVFRSLALRARAALGECNAGYLINLVGFSPLK